METFTNFAETAAIAVGGILLRLLVAVVLLAAIAVPLAAFFKTFEWGRRVLERAQGLMRDGTVLWRQGLFYAPGHTWLAALADGSVRIGLDDIAQKVLPGARVLQLAPVGGEVKKGDALAMLEVGTHRFPVASPTDGRIVAVNDRVAREPELLHRDPYRRGWLAAVAPLSRSFERLPTGEHARGWMRAEDRRLNTFLETELGIAAADGGEWIVAPATMLSDEQFEALRREFLTPQ